MNMIVFEKVAARELSPEQAADQLIQLRQPEPNRHGWVYRLAYGLCLMLLGALIPSLSERRS